MRGEGADAEIAPHLVQLPGDMGMSLYGVPCRSTSRQQRSRLIDRPLDLARQQHRARLHPLEARCDR